MTRQFPWFPKEVTRIEILVADDDEHLTSEGIYEIIATCSRTGLRALIDELTALAEHGEAGSHVHLQAGEGMVTSGSGGHLTFVLEDDRWFRQPPCWDDPPPEDPPSLRLVPPPQK